MGIGAYANNARAGITRAQKLGKKCRARVH